jgi:hypothetical protein
MKIEIININTYQEEDYIYIGRPSKYGNPYSSKEKNIADHQVDSRNESIVLCEEYFNNRPDIIDDLIEELKSKGINKLGCFCYPKKCHGDILKRLIEERNYKSIF